MMKIEIVPYLEHCVENIARRRHAELARRLIAGEPGGEETEKELELLRMFLETADFGKLRSESEKHLVKGGNVRFLLWYENTSLRFEMIVVPADGRQRL